MLIRKPTRKELNENLIYDSTSGFPWDPRTHENDGVEAEITQEHGVTYYNFNTATKPVLPDMSHVQRSLGWK